jgi:hypothetical protein
VVANDGVDAETLNKTTLYPLLEMAITRKLITLPFADQKVGVKEVCDVRNTLLHGNYAQAAINAKCASVGEYFKTQFASEVESMTKVTDHIMKQIDPQTGKPVKPA